MLDYVLLKRLSVEQLTFYVLHKSPVYAGIEKPVGDGLESATHWPPQITHGGYSMVKPVSTDRDRVVCHQAVRQATRSISEAIPQKRTSLRLLAEATR